MKSHFLNLLQYEIWANQQVWVSIAEKPILNSKIELLFTHLLSAQKVWVNRCTQHIESINIWEQKSNLEDLMLANNETWKNYLNRINEEDLETVISYKTSNGTSFKTSVKDILTHLFNHGTYHRGQIVQLLKEEREILPVTDYILFVRYSSL